MRRAGAVAALVVACNSVMIVPVAGQDGVELFVAADGSGGYETISDAIETASDGDTIRIAPGTYVEHLEIDKDLTLSGVGDRSQVIIEPPADQDERVIVDTQTGLVLIEAEDVDITLEGFTLAPRFGYGILVLGGTARIRDIEIPDTILALQEADVSIEDSDLHLLEFGGASDVTVSGSVLRNGAFAWDGATVSFEDNEVIGRPIVADAGGRVTVTGNSFTPTEDEVGVVIVDPESVGHITDNEFNGGWAGIILEYPVESTAERNTIIDAAHGIVAVESGGVIRDNAISGASEYGIQTVGEGMTIEGNTIEGGRVGLFSMTLPGELHPRATDYQSGPFLDGNTITGASHFGVLIEDAPVELSGNVICAEREPLKIEGEANLILGTNEICDPEVEG